MVKDGDIFGDGVNVAARLEGIAEPGGICVTRGVRDHLRDRMEYKFEDLGEHSVKNIARPVRVFRVSFDPKGTTELAPSEPRSLEAEAAPPMAMTARCRAGRAGVLAIGRGKRRSQGVSGLSRAISGRRIRGAGQGAAGPVRRHVVFGRSHDRARVLEFDQGHRGARQFPGLPRKISGRRVQQARARSVLPTFPRPVFPRLANPIGDSRSGAHRRLHSRGERRHVGLDRRLAPPIIVDAASAAPKIIIAAKIITKIGSPDNCHVDASHRRGPSHQRLTSGAD